MENKKGKGLGIGIVIFVFLLIMAIVVIIFIIIPKAQETFFNSELSLVCENNHCVEGRPATAEVTISNEGKDFIILAVKIKSKNVILATLSSQSKEIVSGGQQKFELEINTLPEPTKKSFIEYQICLTLDHKSSICDAINSKKWGIDCKNEQCDPSENEYKQIEIIKEEDRECDSNYDCGEIEKCEISSDGKSECVGIECGDDQEILNHTCVNIETPEEKNESGQDSLNETVQNDTNQST